MYWLFRRISSYIATLIGTPADTDVSTDIANVYTDTQSIDAKDAGDYAVTTNGTVVQDGATGAPSIAGSSTSASANTFGNWATVDASVSADSWIAGFTINFASNIAADTFLCVEIGTGDTPAAKIRVSLAYIVKSDVGKNLPMYVPLPVPIKVASGTKISARASNSTAASIAFYIGLSMYQNL